MIGRTLSPRPLQSPRGAEPRRHGQLVYKALDLKLNREVALKVLPPELVSDPERKRRFVQEAKAAAALKHPNIAHVYEIDEVEGETFIAMELIEGEKLGDLMQRERLPVARSLQLAVEVAEGLSRAHDKGIVHRDVKPANLMVTEDGHAKIIDFGLAKLLEPIGSEDSDVETAIRGKTQAEVRLGTVAYMSPCRRTSPRPSRRERARSMSAVMYSASASSSTRCSPVSFLSRL